MRSRDGRLGVFLMKTSLLKSLSFSLFCLWSVTAGWAQDATPTPAATPTATLESAAVPASRGPKWEARSKGNNAEAKQRAQEIAVVFDGDSITDWWKKTGLPLWNERYAPLGAMDFGISGDRTQSVLWRLANGQLDGLKPKVVFLMIGTNNTDKNDAQQIADGVAAIVKEYRTRCPEAVIVVQAIFPRGEALKNARRTKIAAANELIAKLADGDKVVFLDFTSKLVNADGTISPEVMPDFLHLSPKGYEIWAEAIQPTVDKYFPKP